MSTLKKHLPWLMGAFIATGVFATIKLFSYMRFENSDDILIVKAFMGFEGGVPATFNLYLHTLLSRFLGLISTIAPGVAWFSLVELGALWLSVAVCCKCIIGLAITRGRSFVAGAVGALIFAAVFCAFACARINFTVTAALLCSAGVAELCAAKGAQRHNALYICLSLALMIFGYMLRPQSFIAALPFWLLALVWALTAKGGLKPSRGVGVALLAGAACLVALIGIRYFEMQDPTLKALDEFQAANLKPMDYDEQRLLSVSDKALEHVGWSRAELKLVRQWYFMDENITAEAFNRLSYELGDGRGSGLSKAPQVILGFFRANRRYLSLGLCMLSLCGLCVALAIGGSRRSGNEPPIGSADERKNKASPVHSSGGLLSRIREEALLTPAAAMLCLLGCAAMLTYLACAGRFLGRAADCALIPAAALMCCMAAYSLKGINNASKASRAVCLLVCATLVLAGGWNAALTKATLSDRPDTVSATREADLEAFALDNADKLILRTPDLLRDTRLLPQVSGGVPANIMIWGDWYCRTPSWYGQLERYGIDGRHFAGKDFLRDNLLFVTERERPPEALLTYLEEQNGRPVEARQYASRGELRFFSFE